MSVLRSIEQGTVGHAGELDAGGRGLSGPCRTRGGGSGPWPWLRFRKLFGGLPFIGRGQARRHKSFREGLPHLEGIVQKYDSSMQPRFILESLYYHWGFWSDVQATNALRVQFTLKSKAYETGVKKR